TANIGNARVAGLQVDLGITDVQYQTAITVTYVPYIVAELPSNLVLKKFGPRGMIPGMCLAWGIVTTLQSQVFNFGGLLAAAIQQMNGIGGLRGWQWIFLLEGLFTVCFGVFAFFILPDTPH
ncbi:hypothetical protein B0A49_11531, partial [Cryomyces minteri]